jgi:APA family basic amino acid/polyamine antiporter
VSAVPPVSLLRVLGPATAIALVVGNVIGSGVFAKPGTIAAQGGDFILIISAWIFGGVLCLLGSLCFAELAAAMPHSGGPYVYLREAYGKPIAFLFGWTELLLARPGGIGALGTFFVIALFTTLGWSAGVWTQIAAVSGIIVLMAWVNVLGVVWGAAVQNLTTIIKAGGVGLVALTPFVLHLVNGSSVDWTNYATTYASASQDPSWSMRFGLVLLAVMWAYHGWSSVTPVAEEIRDPQRNVPLALVAGIGIIALLYVSANVSYHGVLPMDQLAAAGNKGAHVVAEKLLGEAGGVMLTAIILCSTFGAINSNLLVSPRVAYAMGRDGAFFRALGTVHVIYRTPAIAIVAQASMAIALLVLSGFVSQWAATLPKEGLTGPYLWREILARLRDKSVFELLTNFVVFASAVFDGLCVLGVMLLRRKHPEWPRPYRVPFYPLLPVLFLIFYIGFLVLVFLGAPFEALAGLVLVGLGLPVHFLWRLLTKPSADA